MGEKRFFVDVLYEIDSSPIQGKALHYLPGEQLAGTTRFLDSVDPVLAGDWSSQALYPELQAHGRLLASLLDQTPPRQRSAAQHRRATLAESLSVWLAADSSQWKSPWIDLVPSAKVGAGGRLVDDDYILRVNDQLARSRGEITALRVRAEQMRTASVDDVVEGSFPEELTSEALNRLRNSYSELRQQQAVLSASLGPRHPQRIANEQALAAARDAIRNEVNRIVAATQTELRRAEQTDTNLAAQFDDLKTKQLATSESFVKLRELERELEIARWNAQHLGKLYLPGMEIEPPEAVGHDIAREDANR